MKRFLAFLLFLAAILPGVGEAQMANTDRSPFPDPDLSVPDLSTATFALG